MDKIIENKHISDDCKRIYSIQDISNNKQYSISSALKNRAGKDEEIHFHDFYELELVTEGDAGQIVNNKKYSIKKGSIYLMTPADIHQYTLEKNKGFNLLGIQFTSEFLSNEILSMIYTLSTPLITIFEGEEFEYAYTLLNGALNESRAKADNYDSIIRRSVEILCLLIFRKIKNNTDNNISVYSDPRIQNIITYVKQNFRKKLTVESIASEFSLTPNYLGKIFHENMDKLLTEYIKETRLNAALNLISGTNYTLKQISFEVGFRSYEDFSREFKKHFGNSPRFYKYKKNE